MKYLLIGLAMLAFSYGYACLLIKAGKFVYENDNTMETDDTMKDRWNSIIKGKIVITVVTFMILLFFAFILMPYL